MFIFHFYPLAICRLSQFVMDYSIYSIDPVSLRTRVSVKPWCSVVPDILEFVRWLHIFVLLQLILPKKWRTTCTFFMTVYCFFQFFQYGSWKYSKNTETSFLLVHTSYWRPAISCKVYSMISCGHIGGWSLIAEYYSVTFVYLQSIHRPKEHFSLKIFMRMTGEGM